VRFRAPLQVQLITEIGFFVFTRPKEISWEERIKRVLPFIFPARTFKYPRTDPKLGSSGAAILATSFKQKFRMQTFGAHLNSNNSDALGFVWLAGKRMRRNPS
jgi:hypothetical protein